MNIFGKVAESGKWVSNADVCLIMNGGSCVNNFTTHDRFGIALLLREGCMVSIGYIWKSRTRILYGI